VISNKKHVCYKRAVREKSLVLLVNKGARKSGGCDDDKWPPHILSHVLSVQEGVASNTLETPDVPLRVERNQGLAFNDFLGAAGAF
jgi:hypothetical protein